MAKSMTGYGTSFISDELCDVKVEIRTLNSKYCDISLRMPKNYIFLEVELRNLIKRELVRGKIDVFVEVFPKKVVNLPILNRNMLSSYMGILRELQMESEIIDDIRIDHILKFNDVISYLENEDVYHEIGGIIKRAVKQCLVNVDEMRRKEGEILIKDIKSRVESIRLLNDKLKGFSDKNYNTHKERLYSRFQELNLEIDKERIEQEIAMILERSDITEEVIRIDSHLNQMLEALEDDEVGKKLDFLAQELHREFNTVGSKALLSDIKGVVINAKVEIDKIREQVQNLV